MQYRRAIFLIFSLAALEVVFVSGCSESDPAVQQLVQQAPQMTEEMAHHLLHDDPDELREYMTQFDVSSLSRIGRHLCTFVDTTSVTRFIDSRESNYSLAAPIFMFLEQEFDLADLHNSFRQLTTLEPEKGLRLTKAWRYGRKWLHEDSLSVEQRITGLEKVVAIIDAQEIDWYPAHYKYCLGCLLYDRGQTAEGRALMLEAIAGAKTQGWLIMACQAMGTLGYWAGQDGDFETMARLYEEFKQLALRHGLADQAARACLFLGAYYQDQGRLNLAFACYREAERIGHDMKSYTARFRSQLYLVRLYIELGCWNLARQTNDGARDYWADLWRTREPVLAVHRTRLAELELLCLIQEGQIDAGSDGYRRILRELPAGWGTADSVRLYLDWSQVLLEQGRVAQTMEILDEAKSVVARSTDTDCRTKYKLLRAQALYAIGRLAECEDELIDLSREIPDGISNPLRAWSQYDALRIHLALATGDRDVAAQWLQTGLQRLRKNLARLEASQENYLQHQAQNPLHEVMEGILADHPDRDLLAHLLWRQFPRYLGADRRDGSGAGASDLAVLSDLLQATVRQQTLPSSVQAVWQTYREALAKAGGLHLVYTNRGETVVRWQISGDSLQREELALNSTELCRLTKLNVEAISREPVTANGTLDRAACRNLYELAQHLLPPHLLSGSESAAPACLYLTVDGCLNTLPFAVLNLDAESYVPLLENQALIYLRGLRGTIPPAAAPGPGIVVTAPLVHDNLQRLLGGLPDLDQARAEAEFLAAQDPDTRLLCGEQATKTALLNMWQEAGYLYFAGHVARDPQVPYRSFVPLTDTEDEVLLDASLLGVQDIRRCRFDRVPLVVISGCASGAAYVTETTGAPSLCDVFLDAGVQTAVQTFWSVSDAAGLDLMSRFIRKWRVEGLAPEHALWQARRELWIDGDGPHRHPFYWASYAVKQAGIQKTHHSDRSRF